MISNLRERVESIANYICDTHNTIRQTAEVFGCSKSTVHNDVSKKLKKIDMNLYNKVKKILDKNFADKHLRGGEATKQKYIKMRLKKE